MKNIPLGGNKEYVMQLTHSIRKVVYAMSWAAFIFLNDIQCEDKETYGFRSQKPMPMVEELKDFKDACVWGHCRHSRKHMLLAAKVRMPAL